MQVLLAEDFKKGWKISLKKTAEKLQNLFYSSSKMD